MIHVTYMMGVITILGGISSGIGGFLGGVIPVKSNHWIASLYELTAGIMTGIVCIDMIPESFKMAPIWYNLIGMLGGVFLVAGVDYMVGKQQAQKQIKNNRVTLSLVVIISMAIHNVIEGLALGSGFSYSVSLGLSLLISIFLHDIPEGMVVGITSKSNQQSLVKIVCHSVLVGLCVGIGFLIGYILGDIHPTYIAISLSIAAGAMLYIVACDLIPMSKTLSSKKMVSIVYILGILVGAIVTKV